MISHRITKVLEDEAGNLSFNTKGDNNSAIDTSQVAANDICGLVKGKIPFAGLPVVWVKTMLQDTPQNVEF